jgi:hypothetical protein
VGEGRTDQPKPYRRRVPVREAAEALGITAEAVRMRIKRGTLRSERQAGRVFVLLGSDQPTEHTTERTELTDPREELIAQLRSEVEAWREEARRKDHLLAAALERIPQLEAPASPQRESPETVEDASGGASPRPATEGPQEGTQRPQGRPWWRRWF